MPSISHPILYRKRRVKMGNEKMGKLFSSIVDYQCQFTIFRSKVFLTGENLSEKNEKMATVIKEVTTRNRLRQNRNSTPSPDAREEGSACCATRRSSRIRPPLSGVPKMHRDENRDRNLLHQLLGTAHVMGLHPRIDGEHGEVNLRCLSSQIGQLLQVIVLRLFTSSGVDSFTQAQLLRSPAWKTVRPST